MKTTGVLLLPLLLSVFSAAALKKEKAVEYHGGECARGDCYYRGVCIRTCALAKGGIPPYYEGGRRRYGPVPPPLVCCEGNLQRYPCGICPVKRLPLPPPPPLHCGPLDCKSPSGRCRPHGFYYEPKDKKCCDGQWIFGHGPGPCCGPLDCKSPSGRCRPNGFYYEPKDKVCCDGQWLYGHGDRC